MLLAPRILLDLLVYSSKRKYNRKKALNSVPASALFPDLAANASDLWQH